MLLAGGVQVGTAVAQTLVHTCLARFRAGWQAQLGQSQWAAVAGNTPFVTKCSLSPCSWKDPCSAPPREGHHAFQYSSANAWVGTLWRRRQHNELSQLPHMVDRAPGDEAVN
jgi:hypothetical protein